MQARSQVMRPNKQGQFANMCAMQDKGVGPSYYLTGGLSPVLGHSALTIALHSQGYCGLCLPLQTSHMRGLHSGPYGSSHQMDLLPLRRLCPTATGLENDLLEHCLLQLPHSALDHKSAAQHSQAGSTTQSYAGENWQRWISLESSTVSNLDSGIDQQPAIP
jgi:hypothetical protein